MRRINRVISRLESGKPVFGTTIKEVSRASGESAAHSWADWLIVEMEHRPFDIAALAAFMQGYAATRRYLGGVEAPAVSVTLPIDGLNEDAVRVNGWMVKQVLATGVHGLMLCHAETPGAAEAMVEAMRYSLRGAEPERAIGPGRRGHGGQDLAAAIWDLPSREYMERADLWPLNPEGELILGVKIENPRALANAESTLAVPGITYAEWGPADMSLAHGMPGRYDEPVMREARRRVKEACQKTGVRFLENARPDTVVRLIDENVAFITCSEETARIGREHADGGRE